MTISDRRTIALDVQADLAIPVSAMQLIHKGAEHLSQIDGARGNTITNVP